MVTEKDEKKLTEKVHVPVWVTDKEGKVLYGNRIFELYFRYRLSRRIIPFENIQPILTELLGIEWQRFIDQIHSGKRKKFETQLNVRGKELFYEIEANADKLNTNEARIYFLAYNITDRKKSIGIVHKAKNQLQSLINNIPALVWLKNANGELVVCNQKFKDFFGWNSDFLASEKKSLLPERAELFDYLFDDSYIIERKKHFTEEKLFIIKDENRWFEIHKTPIFTESGEYVGTSGMAQEITQRKIIENILLESEEKFRQFAENTSDAFVLSNHNGVLYINPEFERIFGHSVNEGYKHKHIPGEWIHPEDRDKIVQYFNSEEFLLSGKFNGQYRIIRPDGSTVWIWERVFPVKDDEGNIIRYISVISDITRQKQLEAELLISHAQQQAILDNIPHMAWLKDIGGRYISVNEAFARKFKRQKDDIIGHTDSEIMDSEAAELQGYNDYLVVNSRQSQRFEESIDAPEGTSFFETIKTPVFDNEGNIIGITGISIDVTPYKKMEMQLRANDDRIKALLLHSTESITVVDTEGRVIFDTSFFYKVAGINAEEAQGHPFTEFVSPSDEGLVLYAINKAIENPDEQQEAVYACVKPNGSIVYFESFFSNHIDNQLIKGIVINSRDITEKKIAESKEQAYQQRVSFLEKTALDFLSISSSDEIYRYIGENIRELVPNSVVIFSSYHEDTDALVIKHLSGLNKYMGVVNDILGRDPINYAMPLTASLKRKLFISSNKLHELNGGLYNITHRQIDYMVCKALEKLISLNKAYGMGIVRSGKLLGSVVILTRYEQHIDDPRVIETFLYQASIALQRRRLEKELIKAKERAEESDRLKTAFLANMSHEIRTPINGIIGFSQLLEQAFDDPEKREEFIQIIRTNANLLLSLIDDIIDVSRIQEGQVKLKKTIVNINLLLDDILTPYMNPISQGKDIQTQIEKSLPDEEAIVLADPLRLKQILNNLISNAFKFTEKGSITVGYTVDNDMIIFYVADTGIGIPKDKQEEIFQRFMQADVSLTRRYGGTGLGLAISKGLVELMGGKIWVESTEGLGSKFYFSIPGLCNYINASKNLTSSFNNLMIN